MRTRLKNHNEVAHFWANKSQKEGRSGNMFFEEERLFSYGYHFEIARLVKDRNMETVALFQDRSYSTSTAGHQSIARRAVSHLTTFHVLPDGGAVCIDHGENLKYLLDKYGKAVEQFKTRRSSADFWRDEAIERFESASDYWRRFLPSTHEIPEYFREGMKRRENELMPWGDDEEKALEGLRRRAENHEKAQAVKFERKQTINKERERLRLIEMEKNRAAWLAGESVYYSSPWNEPVFLRLKNGRIETSAGADISESAARLFWKALKNGRDVTGFDFGAYRVDSFDGEILRAGCHRIPLAEINRMAAALGLS
jgi:hypothetical protein